MVGQDLMSLADESHQPAPVLAGELEIVAIGMDRFGLTPVAPVDALDRC